MDIAADPIPAFIERVTEVERATALSQDEAITVVNAGLDDMQIAAVVDLLMSDNVMTLAKAIDLVKRPLFHYKRIRLAGQQTKRPAYATQLLQNFNGISRKRSRPAPRKRAKR